jgi:hypothetical protein
MCLSLALFLLSYHHLFIFYFSLFILTKQGKGEDIGEKKGEIQIQKNNNGNFDQNIKMENT